MNPIRVYVDTSVFGGTQDEEFSFVSNRFFERVQNGEYVVLLSAETLRELSKSPLPVQNILENLSQDHLEEVQMDEKVSRLANSYIQAGVLGKSSISDALHIAAATVAEADLLLSWNFKHIVNFNRIRGYNNVNHQLGYPSMTILSPLEVVYE